MTTPPINYDPNTPTVQLPFADWQIQFQENFTQLSTAFSENHVALESASNAGNHTYLEMVEQADTSKPQASIGEFTIYSKNVKTQTDQVFFTYPGNTPVVQFTNYQIYSVTPTANQITYFTFLPGGLLVYFGEFGPISNSSLTANTLFLNPPIAKNIISVNFCWKGTTPDFTPSWAQGAKLNETKSDLVPIVNQIIINPQTPVASNTNIYYTIVVNI